MKSTTMKVASAVIIAGFALPLLGCSTHRHDVQTSYEYSDDRVPPPTETHREQVDSEWRMTSPGTMVVDPSKR